jgi:hypothetical protein
MHGKILKFCTDFTQIQKMGHVISIRTGMSFLIGTVLCQNFTVSLKPCLRDNRKGPRAGKETKGSKLGMLRHVGKAMHNDQTGAPYPILVLRSQLKS